MQNIRLMPGHLLLNGRGISLLQHLPLHPHIDFDINVRGVDVRVPEPVAYHVDIISRTQQMHSSGVPDGVRGHGLSLEGWAPIISGYRVFTGDMADYEASDGSTVGVKKQMLGSWLFRGALFQVSLKRSNRFRP